MAVLALAGDTMLGRRVADVLLEDPRAPLVGPRLRAELAAADAVVLNLECCISARGERWPAPGKPFFFRAPPLAAHRLAELGVRAVTLANNHALDYGPDALLDTLAHLAAAGVAAVGAGPDEAAARRPAALEVAGEPLVLLGLTDHPADFAAAPDRPGVAFADLRSGVPGWVTAAIGAARAPVLASPHWGPNMATEPLPYVRRAADELVRAGAALVAGHSAHVLQGVAGRVLFDLGDFLDDYAVHPTLRNDLGALWLVHLTGGAVRAVEAVPVRLRLALSELADGDDAAWVRRRLQAACAALGTDTREDGDRVRIAVG
ncbi:CapA family protein [Georgenia thermotolerans]|uniref:CapA family protein n=1 Tax=Georgenia thermotolerans TaxID=527326 RepID=A0A7J5UN27_9MICO|nr:CapA family protein [Georgenia thermotolerans]KAE8763798.1 CapA family protein [Georgenia thermotolerans]